MTIDYNETLLDYISGDLTVESQNVNEFRGNEQITNNIIQELRTAIGKQNIDYGMRILSSEKTSNYIMYGTYIDEIIDENNYTERSFIAIMDQAGNLLHTYTTYSSGTKFGIFQTLDYDENGNIYGIEYFNSNYRVILLNNVAIETSLGFVCKLRNSYYISDTTFLPPTRLYIGTSFIKKDPNNDSTYYIMGQKASGGSYVICLCKFTINVGSTNDWEYISGPTIASSGQVFAYDYILQTVGTTTVAHIYYYGTNTQSTLNHAYYNGTTLTAQTDINITTRIYDFRVLDDDTIYVSSSVNNGGDYTMYLYQVDGNSLTLISSNTVNLQIPSYYLNLINGKLFGRISGLFTNDLSKIVFICNVYDGNSYIESPAYEIGAETIVSSSCAIQQTYSLYKFIMQGQTTLYRPYIVIYDNQYSGGSYVSYNSLTPLHSEIYSNSSLVFARGLYNKQVYQNMCVSTVNIPNNYLNGIPLMPSKLLGTTMLELVSNTDTITKNVYENLFINFNNKIQVIDEDTSVFYPETANYINISVSYGTQQNYEGQKISKMKINYVDDTNRVIPFHWTDNGGIKEYTYSIYVSKAINSIDFMNAEENFTYISKQYDFEIGKTYTITQRLRID